MVKKVVHVSGKRKMAIARATLRAGKGIVRINNQLLDTFKPEIVKIKIMEPLVLAGALAKEVDIEVKVIGGGKLGQAEASRLTIARGLVEYSDNKALKQKFLDYDRHLLIQDVRFKETNKPNDSKARAKRQKSYR